MSLLNKIKRLFNCCSRESSLLDDLFDEDFQYDDESLNKFVESVK